ncbi:MAG: hypothetical protein D3904_09895 [Candidatus Electrothrix sp. EH2]|nr:hypothetical protein [Candidatus Electrothrix sp. EH2]
MVVRKDQLNQAKKQEKVNPFEKFFIIMMWVLSLLVLLVTSWIFFIGDDVIFLYGSDITPRNFSFLVYVQSFFPGRAVSDEQENNSGADSFAWAF